MRVLKFGGTSIGDADSILAVSAIVQGRSGESMVLVFSAMAAHDGRARNLGRAAARGRPR